MEQNENIQISDFIKLTKISTNHVKKALIARVGGLGDCLILTPIAKELHKRGYQVDFFIGSPTGQVFQLFEKLPYLHSIKKVQRLNGIDCIEDEQKNFVSLDILKSGYDEVFDFKFSIEENRAGFNKIDEWRRSINSNYMNWVDLSFAWSNIDWTQISDEDKRPEISIPEKYHEWALNEVPDEGRVIGIQLQASSLTRTWYRAMDLPELLHTKYMNDTILVFAGNEWVMMAKYGRKKIDVPEGFDPILCSVALINQMAVFISADSGMSHVAEAVGTHSIDIYTTVPAWTRIKYYKFAHPLEAKVPCHPCFVLDQFCPLEKKKAEESLSEREKRIFQAGNSREDIMKVAKEFQTIPKAIDDEFGAIRQKIGAISATMPACVGNITPKMITDKVAEIFELLESSKEIENEVFSNSSNQLN